MLQAPTVKVRRRACPRSIDQVIEAKDIVHALRGYGFTQAMIAQATGATERSVRNWERTSALRRKKAERLQDLREIVLLLKQTLTERGVGQWFCARNRVLQGRRPIEILAEGKLEELREAAQAYVEGAYV